MIIYYITIWSIYLLPFYFYIYYQFHKYCYPKGYNNNFNKDIDND